MPQVTSFQIFGAIISVAVAFLMKLAADYMPKDGAKDRKLTFRSFLYRFIMSFGAAFFVMLMVIDRDITDTWKLGILGVTSFLGSELVNGLSGIKSTFFTGLFKDIIQSWAKKIINLSDEPKPMNYDEPNAEIQRDVEVQEDGEGEVGVEQ